MSDRNDMDRWTRETLHQTLVELERRNRDLEAFAHTVAHALKTPLAVIMGLAETLSLRSPIMPDKEMQHCVKVIVRNGRKMSNIIDELLTLAHVHGAKVEVGPLDMASIVANARRRLLHLIEKYQAEIIAPDAWPEALGYGPWVEEVWINYVSNAIQYGGRPPRVELGYDATPAHFGPDSACLNDTGTQTNGRVRFWVRDNGPGIRVEDQARLFAPFVRLDQARTQGYGLGLSIVQRIVRGLGGEVGVESQLGQGSTFAFTLPKDQVS